MQQSSHLPPIQLSSQAALTFVGLLEDRIRAEVEAYRDEPDTEHDPVEDAIYEAEAGPVLTEFLASGTVPTPRSGLSEVVVSGRRRVWEFGPTGTDADRFAPLDEDGLMSAELSFSSNLAGLWTLRVSCNQFRTDISLSPSILRLKKPELDIEEVEGLILQAFPLAPEIPLEPVPAKPFRVFIGHGNDHQWRILRDELRDSHDFDIEAFEGRPRAGMTIKDVLEDMAANSIVAVLVLVASDEMANSTWNGRQNVVHEIGFFQARLGWRNAIVVAEDGVNLFSNLDGTQQIRFPKDNIQSAVGSLVSALNARKREHEGL